MSCSVPPQQPVSNGRIINVISPLRFVFIAGIAAGKTWLSRRTKTDIQQCRKNNSIPEAFSRL